MQSDLDESESAFDDSESDCGFDESKMKSVDENEVEQIAEGGGEEAEDGGVLLGRHQVHFL